MLLSTDWMLPKNRLVTFTLMGPPSRGGTHLSLASQDEWEPGNPIKSMLDPCSPKSSCNILFLGKGAGLKLRKRL